MKQETKQRGASDAGFFRAHWRSSALVLVALTALAGLMTVEPIAQDPRYHALADGRTIAGVPNFANVASNLPFLIFGVAGLLLCLRTGKPATAPAWATFFAGVALVSVGSGYYHLGPTNAALVWDRLPMTLAFMGLFVALLGEHIHPALGRRLLVPAVVLGLASIGWWRYTGDLRLYIWVQSAPLLAIPLALLLFAPRYTERRYLLYGLGLYALAKVAELYDDELYVLTSQTLSGHTLKHLLASGSALCVYWMLRRRQPLPPAFGNRYGRRLS